MVNDYAYTLIGCQAHPPMQLRFNVGMRTLGERIKYYRELQELTQAELANLVDLDQTFISKLERIDTQETTKIPQIAKALKVDAYWLATGEGSATPHIPVTKEGQLAAKLIDGIRSREERQKALKIIDTLSEPSDGTHGQQ